MAARIIDLSIVRARKAQATLAHHQPLFDSTPCGIECSAEELAEAFDREEAEYARLANLED